MILPKLRCQFDEPEQHADEKLKPGREISEGAIEESDIIVVSNRCSSCHNRYHDCHKMPLSVRRFSSSITTLLIKSS